MSRKKQMVGLQIKVKFPFTNFSYFIMYVCYYSCVCLRIIQPQEIFLFQNFKTCSYLHSVLQNITKGDSQSTWVQ